MTALRFPTRIHTESTPTLGHAPVGAPHKHSGDAMSAIDYLHAAPQDRYEAVSVGDPPRASERKLSRAARQGLCALGFALIATGIMAGLMSLRFLGFLPASFHLHG